MKPRITLSSFDTLLFHVTERFVEFYITYNHARLNKMSNIIALHEINKIITSIFHCFEYSDGDIRKLKIISAFWDSVQCNFSYDKILNPSLLGEDEKAKYHDLILFINKIQSIPEFSAAMNFTYCDFPHLNWIRIADIINVVTPRDFLEIIKSAKEYSIKKRQPGINDNDQPIDISFDTDSPQFAPIRDALSFYPEKLKQGISYIYPLVDEHAPISTLAIACHFNADEKEIQEALEEFSYQLERFRNHNHADSNKLSESVVIEKLRPLLKRNHNENKHLKRKGTVEEPIYALICWEEIYLNGKEINEAIKSVLPVDSDSNKRSSLKKRLKHISTSIDEWDWHHRDMNEL